MSSLSYKIKGEEDGACARRQGMAMQLKKGGKSLYKWTVEALFMDSSSPMQQQIFTTRKCKKDTRTVISALIEYGAHEAVLQCSILHACDRVLWCQLMSAAALAQSAIFKSTTVVCANKRSQ